MIGCYDFSGLGPALSGIEGAAGQVCRCTELIVLQQESELNNYGCKHSLPLRKMQWENYENRSF